MKTQTPVTRNIPTTVECNVNGRKLFLNGDVTIHSGVGKCSARLDFDRSTFPAGFQPELLTFMKITGYPEASLSIGAASNPFSVLSGDFQTVRSLDLGSSGWLTSEYGSLGRGSLNERLVFKVTGECRVEQRIRGILPSVELWQKPSSTNLFFGHMNFSWLLADGRTLSGGSASEYRLDSASALDAEHLRMITFGLQSSESSFEQHETIKLYRLSEWEAGLDSERF
jgi:hypothetical protein